MTIERRVLVHQDRTVLALAVATRFLATVGGIVAAKGEANVALTGGGLGTEILAAINASPRRDSIDWSKVSIWWGDERFVPAGDSERNDTGARAALLDHVGLVPQHVHPFPAAGETDDLDSAARQYAADLAAAARDGEATVNFDVMFLGVGPDGHVASLFPGREGIRVTERGVVAVRNSPKPPPERLSLTLPAINASDRIWLCLAGADKASAFGLALADASTVEVPAAGVEGRLETLFFVDEDAAAGVPEGLSVRE
ncbi:MAG: 6-phosphogluconolactonase [Terrimesophilobacter sp.]